MRVFANRNFFTSTSPACSATSGNPSTCSASSDATYNLLILTMIANGNSAQNTNYFVNNNGSSYLYHGFTSVTLNAYSSIFSTNTVDFYILTGGTGASYSSTIKHRLINSFVFPTALSNSALTLAVSNFFSSPTDYLDGSKFPAFLRITGTIPTYSTISLRHMAIFFDQLNVLYTDDDMAACAGSDDTITCEYYAGDRSSRNFQIWPQIRISNFNTGDY